MRHLTIILLLAVPPACFGWGRDGHKIIAQIAADRLTPEAKSGVAALLGEQSLPDASIWADDIRRDPAYRWSAPFHYANVEPGADAFDLKRDCPEQGCVVSAIIRYAEVLRDGNAEQARKVEALKFLVHFVGDVHNPMHVAYARDRGGNDVAVEFFHNRMNLHRVWDSGLVDRTQKKWSDCAAELGRAITPEHAARWKGFDPAAWATESYKLAVSHAYAIPKDGQLGQEYFDRGIPVVDERFSQAGVRLAEVLNDILGRQKGPATAPPPFPIRFSSQRAKVGLECLAAKWRRRSGRGNSCVTCRSVRTGPPSSDWGRGSSGRPSGDGRIPTATKRSGSSIALWSWGST